MKESSQLRQCCSRRRRPTVPTIVLLSEADWVSVAAASAVSFTRSTSHDVAPPPHSTCMRFGHVSTSLAALI